MHILHRRSIDLPVPFSLSVWIIALPNYQIAVFKRKPQAEPV